MSGHLELDVLGAGVLDRVREPFAGDEVGRCLDVGRVAVAGRRNVDRYGRTARKVTKGGPQACLEQRGAQAVCQLAQLVDGRSDLGHRAVQRLSRA